MAFTKIAAAGIGSTGTVTLENLVVTGGITAALSGTATSTTNIPNLSGAITSNNTTTSLGSFTSAQLATALTDETGSGANVFATSPTLITPALGAATATSLVVSGISTLGITTATNLTAQSLVVSGVSTLGNVVVGGGTTQLIVTGNARITGILTVGTSSITLDGSNNQINVGTGVTLSSSAINVTGIITATSIVVSAGTTALPSISPSGDSNTGIFFPAADTIAFSEGGAEAARIDSSGRLLVGTTSGTFKLQVEASSEVGYFHHVGSSDTIGMIMRHGRGLSGYAGKMVSFRRNDDTEVGNIVIGESSTAYNTSSDYRLKENIITVPDGINRLQQLKPSRFNFIDDPNRIVDGFIAHEAQAVVPECVTGEKDAVDEDGNPKYQGIDQSKLVPLLTAALQEAVAKIESLEARLTAAGID